MRDLGAARRSANDQDAAVGELARIAIGLSGQRRDRWRHAVSEARYPRDIARTRGEHDGSAPPIAPVRAHDISRVCAAHRGDSRMGSHRSRDRLRIGHDEVDDLWQRAIAIRVVAVVAEARQPALPVGSQQTQQVPSLGAPAMGDFTTFQQDMVDGTLREAAAHRKSRVPRANNDGRNGANRAVSSWRYHGRSDQFTWTVTFVGFVTMS